MCDYDAFISYRRSDASPIAHWIRNRLLKYKLPDEILPKLSVKALDLHKRRPRVFIDRAYEKANEDFLTSKIFPALDASARMIVISTPSVFDNIREADGTEAPNWLVREIDYFVSKPNTNTSRKIDLVLGPRGKEQQFPGRLSEKARWDWIDLRAFNKWRSFGFSEELDAGFLKLIASVYDIPEEALPLLRREERRRRQKLIVSLFAGALFFTLIVSALAIGWWGEMKSRQATEFEQKQAEARNLIDIGSIPNAVDILAKVVIENGEANVPEATRLLKVWSARLASARDLLEAVPKNPVLRWRGRNYLKSDTGISFDGPSVLLSRVASDKWLITFEADRVLRLRELGTPALPILETQQLSAKPEAISEYFNGKLLLFDGAGLVLSGDEDALDLEVEFGHVMVIIDPQMKIYAILKSDEDEIKFTAIDGCIQVKDSSVTLIVPNQSNPIDVNQLLTISQSVDGSINWKLGTDGSCSLNVPGATNDYQLEPDTQRTLVTAAAKNDVQYDFSFPNLINERLFWRKVGKAPVQRKSPYICNVEGPLFTVEEEKHLDCFNAEESRSIDPKYDGTLESVLTHQDFYPLDVVQFGMLQRAIVGAVLSNTSVGFAFCDVENRKILNCLTVASTATERFELLVDGQFMVINSEYIYKGAFQLIDIKSLRQIQVNPPPTAQLADINISNDDKWMVVLTKAGEIWLYELDREIGEATITSRFNFRSMINSPRADTPIESAQEGESVQDQFFDSAVFVSENRLVLAGSLGGIVLVEIPAGKTIWSRISSALSGNGWQKVAVADDTLALYDSEAIQFISLESGALLSNVMHFKDLPFSAEDRVDAFETPVVTRGPGGGIQVIYGGAIFEPFSDFPVPSLQSVEQRTGISRGGTDELLPYYVQDK